MANLIPIIKKAAVEAVEASSPVQITYGTVVGTNPLEIKLDANLVLGLRQLRLTRNVTDYEVTTDDSKTIKVHNALKVNEKVALLRTQGGQSYIVLDRVV